MKQIHKRFIWVIAGTLALSIAVTFSRAQNEGAPWLEGEAAMQDDEAAWIEEQAALLGGDMAAFFTLPDLRVHSISAPASASRGALISVSDVTTNAGTANAGQSTSKIYICTDPNNVSSGCLVANHIVSGIAKGKSSTWSGSVTVPLTQPLGVNYYVVVVNADLSLGELNYANNTNYVMIIIN